MKKTRSEKAIINTFSELILQLVTAICAFILPRLILTHFGSAYNGITQSITQFIGCIALLKSGIGSVTRAALYKPLSKNDNVGISEVVNATSNFMKRVAIIFISVIVMFAMVYPFIISNEFDWFFTFTLVIILSISTFAQYFFGLTYQMVLEADQLNYIISIINIFSTILNTIIASILIIMGFEIRIVKLSSAIVFALPPIFYNIYVKNKYNIDKSITPNYSLINERWDAFGHQLADFINLNTDIILITIFLGVKEVSVYTVYYMVANSIKKVINAFETGSTAAFGNMIAKEENERLKVRFEQYEFLAFFISSFLLTVTGILLVPFIKIYTHGIHDINYVRWLFSILVCISVFIDTIKNPYQQIVYAAGKFKKTRNGAFVEAFINIFVSIVLINMIGMNGVIIGTIVALAYRTLRYHFFICENVIQRRKSNILLKLLFSLCIAFTSTILIKKFIVINCISYFQWGINAIFVSIIILLISIVFSFIFFKNDLFEIIKTIKKIIFR